MSSSSSASSSSQEEEEESPTPTPTPTPIKPSSKKPAPTQPQPQPQPASSDDDEEDDESSGESGSDADSDSPVPSPNTTTTGPALDIKPISSKPMTNESKKSNPETPKRRLETDDQESSRKDKKKKVSDIAEEDDADKKKLFQRLWTEEDEIVILKGMASFRKKKGLDPSTQNTAFYEFIKDSLRPDVNRIQLQTKIRGIRKKYQNAGKKLKPGEEPKISKPHELNVYHLSKKVWGDEFVNGEGVGSDVKTKSKKSNGGGVVAAAAASPIVAAPAPAPAPKQKVTEVATTLPNGNPIVAAKEEDDGDIREYTYLNACIQSLDVPQKIVPPPGLAEVFVKRGWSGIGSSKAEAFDERWKNVLIVETKAYLERIDLVREQTQAMLDALVSSNI